MENINFTLNNELDLDKLALSKSNFDNHTLLDEIKFFEGFVDLGLPSKTLWSKFNFGVDINCPFTNYNHFSGEIRELNGEKKVKDFKNSQKTIK